MRHHTRREPRRSARLSGTAMGNEPTVGAPFAHGGTSSGEARPARSALRRAVTILVAIAFAVVGATGCASATDIPDDAGARAVATSTPDFTAPPVETDGLAPTDAIPGVVTRDADPPTATDGDGDALPPAAAIAAQEALSASSGASIHEIRVRSYERAEWPSACLGLSREDEMCAMVVTPGWRVVLELEGDTYVYRTDMDGTVIRREPTEAAGG